MSQLDAQDDQISDVAKTNSRMLHLITTRDWSLRPARRSSPPLSDLFPEYYEPIEPEQTCPILEPSGITNSSSEFEHGDPTSDEVLPEYLHSTRSELLPEKLHSDRELVFLKEGFQKDSSTASSSVPPTTTRLPQSVKSGAPGLTAASKHHCLISGHIFEHYRLSELPIGVEIDGLGPPSQQSTHKQEDLRVCCMICRARIREHFWKCAIPVCLREVCGDCKSRLEQERASGAKAGWRGES